MRKILISLLTVIQLTACNHIPGSTQKEVKTVVIPDFSSDSAYQYTQKQVDFGPRVPNTAGHEACATYLSSELKKFGAVVVDQKADLTAFDGTILHSTNIIGSFNVALTSRVVLFSHWDSRPWADHDPKPANRKQPVMAANDGASGVAVLMEMARLIGKNQPKVGVDIIFLDSEDYGAPESYKGQDTEASWCLGTQYWAKNPHVQGYTARFGILLDMVGGKQATFYK